MKNISKPNKTADNAQIWNGSSLMPLMTPFSQRYAKLKAEPVKTITINKKINPKTLRNLLVSITATPKMLMFF